MKQIEDMTDEELGSIVRKSSKRLPTLTAVETISIHAVAVALIVIASGVDAAKTTVDLTKVRYGDIQMGDWEVIVRRTDTGDAVDPGPGRYRAVGAIAGTKALGEFEADSAEEARELARDCDAAQISLCHHCASECQDPQVERVDVALIAVKSQPGSERIIVRSGSRNCDVCADYLHPRWDCQDCRGTGRKIKKDGN